MLPTAHGRPAPAAPRLTNIDGVVTASAPLTSKPALANADGTISAEARN